MEDEADYEAADPETEENLELRELDPALLYIAEKVIAREDAQFEEEARPRWTRCFSAADIAKVEQPYKDNTSAAGADSGDRSACIVMLNVALGQLLSLPLKANRARSSSTRTVQMGDLTTESIEKAMMQLRNKGYAVAPTVMNFFDRRNRAAGTLKPERLKASVQAKVLGPRQDRRMLVCLRPVDNGWLPQRAAASGSYGRRWQDLLARSVFHRCDRRRHEQSRPADYGQNPELVAGCHGHEEQGLQHNDPSLAPEET